MIIRLILQKHGQRNSVRQVLVTDRLAGHAAVILSRWRNVHASKARAAMMRWVLITMINCKLTAGAGSIKVDTCASSTGCGTTVEAGAESEHRHGSLTCLSPKVMLSKLQGKLKSTMKLTSSVNGNSEKHFETQASIKNVSLHPGSSNSLMTCLHSTLNGCRPLLSQAENCVAGLSWHISEL